MEHRAPIILVLASILTSAGCGPKITDNVLPVIQVVKPTHHQQFLSGDNLPFEALLTDNAGLLNYSVVIKSNFDDHLKTSHPIDPWTFSAHQTATGSSQTITLTPAIPVDVAAGEYLLTVACTDAQGNDAIQQQVEFILKNSTDLTDPTVVITSLVDSLPNNYLAGGSISIQGTITDNEQLGNLEIFLINSSSGIEFEDDLHLAANPYTLDETITAPTIPGNYTLHLVCHDKVNNITIKEFDITIL
jgi:hypothetical protein